MIKQAVNLFLQVNKHIDWLIVLLKEIKLNYYGKAAKHLKISETNIRMLCDDYEGSHFTRAHLQTSMNSPTWVSKLEIRAKFILLHIPSPPNYPILNTNCEIEVTSKIKQPLPLTQYRLWSFQGRDTKLERLLAKINCSQIKLLNFENWSSGDLSKIGLYFIE